MCLVLHFARKHERHKDVPRLVGGSALALLAAALLVLAVAVAVALALATAAVAFRVVCPVALRSAFATLLVGSQQ